MTDALILSAIFLASLGLNLWVMHLLGPMTPFGDEKEYVGTAEKNLWVRVPLHGWLTRGTIALWLHQHATPSLLGAQIFMALSAALGVTLTTAYALSLAGWVAGGITAALLLMSVERAILSTRLWPDVVMGSCIIAFLWSIDPEGGNSLILASCVAAFALGIRMEAALICVIVVALVIANLATTPMSELWPPVAILGMAVVTYIAAKGLRHGVWALDTTARFNKTLARLERAHPDATVRQLMQMARQMSTGDVTNLAAKAHCARVLPYHMGQILGRETFLNEILLSKRMAPTTPTYDPKHPLRSGFLANLRYGFSSLAIGAGLTAPFAPLWAVLAMLVATSVYILVITRSRYRMALMPLYALIVGVGVARMWDAPHSAASNGTIIVLCTLSTLGLLVFLMRHPKRHEHI